VATFHLSKDHLGGHPRRVLLCFNKETTGAESPLKAPKELSQEGNPYHQGFILFMHIGYRGLGEDCRNTSWRHSMLEYHGGL